MGRHGPSRNREGPHPRKAIPLSAAAKSLRSQASLLPRSTGESIREIEVRPTSTISPSGGFKPARRLGPYPVLSRARGGLSLPTTGVIPAQAGTQGGSCNEWGLRAPTCSARPAAGARHLPRMALARTRITAVRLPMNALGRHHRRRATRILPQIGSVRRAGHEAAAVPMHFVIAIRLGLVVDIISGH